MYFPVGPGHLYQSRSVYAFLSWLFLVSFWPGCYWLSSLEGPPLGMEECPLGCSFSMLSGI